MMSELNEMSCGEFGDVAAELALGVLTGRERAAALAHLDTCDSCRENVRQLTMTGEELLALLPAHEPPAGFETRVMERLGLATPSPASAPVTPPAPAPARGTSVIGRIRHFGRKLAGWPGSAQKTQVGRTRRMLATAAVGLAVVAAGLGGWGLANATSSPARSPLSSATLLSASHQSVGKVFYYGDSPHWLYMSVDSLSWNGTVICQLESRDGQVTTVGSFRLAGGYGSWGGPDSVSQSQLTGARLVTANGTVLATASF